MPHWKSRLVVFLSCFCIGLLVFLTVSLFIGITRPETKTAVTDAHRVRPCDAAGAFSSPEDILAALKSDDVLVRRDVFHQLFLTPGVSTIYYDYERDRDYPERAERGEIRYIHLDDSSDAEAVLTFKRYESPVALVLRKEICGWRPAGVLSAWLHFEDYPYQDWLEFPEAVTPGVHEILMRESTGDATRYSRNAHLLKMVDGTLTEVAEFPEQRIDPVENSRETDWSNVKQRQTTRYTFSRDGGRARLRLETEDEIVKYASASSTYTYWLETDGVWHTSGKQWRENPATRLRFLDSRVRELVWDEQRKRFVN